MNPTPYIKQLKSGHYDFLDFGCSKGGSIESSKRKFKVQHGLGLDNNVGKIEDALKAGHDAIHYDILKLPDEKLVSFVVMIHFLEHISDTKYVKKYLEKAVSLSRNFVFIRQPFFDADTYLFKHNLKLYWSDWTHHPNRMTTYEMYLALRDLKRAGLIERFTLHHTTPVPSSNHGAVVPLDAPVNKHEYDPKIHSTKPLTIQFEVPVYRELVALVSQKNFKHETLTNRVKFHKTVYESWRD